MSAQIPQTSSRKKQRKSQLQQYDEAFAALTLEQQRDVLALLYEFMFRCNAERLSEIGAVRKQKVSK